MRWNIISQSPNGSPTPPILSLPHKARPLPNYFGEAPVGLRLRIVEKHVTVTEVLDPAAAQAGVKIGDVVKSWMAKLLSIASNARNSMFPHPHPNVSTLDVVAQILNGPDDSNAAFTLEDPAGNRKEATLKRSKRLCHRCSKLSLSGESVKLLRGGVGYADLTRLKASDVDSMFEKFRACALHHLRYARANRPKIRIAAIARSPDHRTRCTRRYCHRTRRHYARLVARLHRQPVIQLFLCANHWQRQQTGNTKTEPSCWWTSERLNAGEKAGLFLEAANKTEFVGTPTAGAHSVLSNFTLPGGIVISFSGAGYSSR